jgi:hypothetical protein
MPDVPIAWLLVQEQMLLHTTRELRFADFPARQEHLLQFETHALHTEVQACKAAVQEFTMAQTRLCEQGNNVSDQAVVARDQLRTRAIRCLQQLLKKSAIAQQVDDEHLPFSTSAEKFEKATRSISSQSVGLSLPGNKELPPTKDQLQQACNEGCDAITQWRSRHDVSLVTQSTDGALDLL